jgi:P-type E1-E2 ATPase
MADGDARMLVLAVGVNSCWGKIQADLEQEESQTPLQENLEELAKKIGYFGLICAIIVFIVLTLWWIAQRWIVHDIKFKASDLEDFVQFFIIAVTIVVVAVPEGLPLAVTISLAYSMKKMMKDNNLVRHLQACETMGGVTSNLLAIFSLTLLRYMHR